MRRSFLLLLVGLCNLGVVRAAICSCPAAMVCDTVNGKNWTGTAACRDASGPDATDELRAFGRIEFSEPGTVTFQNILVADGGEFRCTFTGASTLQLNRAISPPACQGEEAVFVSPGGTWTCDGKDLRINWTGIGGGVQFVFGGQLASGCYDPVRDVNVTMRGVEREVDTVAVYSEGRTTGDSDFVDCMDGNGTAVTSMNVGDTIVFTSGKSKEYWYRISCNPHACTGAGVPNACCSGDHATTECGATACNGAPCDYQITRNATGSTPGSVASSSTWSSFTKVASLGGPDRQPVPDDSDGGAIAATSSGTRPASGDAFVVFMPILIQGGVNPLRNGISLVWAAGSFNLRYLEIAKTSGQTTDDCSGSNGQGALWTHGVIPSNPEGDGLAFINLHNMANRQLAWEPNFTDRSNDSRSNRPFKASHWYVHDADAQVATMCGSDGVDPVAGFGLGIVLTLDRNDAGVDSIDGFDFTGLHIARLSSGPGLAIASSQDTDSPQYRNIVFRDVLIHDIPRFPTVGNDGTGLVIYSGEGVSFHGLTIWDIGRSGLDGQPLAYRATDYTVAGAPKVTATVDNAWIANIDGNQSGHQNNTDGSVNASLDSDPSVSTDGFSIANSYISRIVGAGGYAGRWLYNYIADTNIEDDGSLPCDPDINRAMLHLPVEAVGNVLRRTRSLSCVGIGILYRQLGESPFTDRAWRAVSNFIENLDSDQEVPVTGIFVRPDGGTLTRDIDISNNFIDYQGNTGGSGNDYGILVQNVGDGALFGGRATAWSNIVANSSSGPGNAVGLELQFAPVGSAEHDCNLFLNVNGSLGFDAARVNGWNDLQAGEYDLDEMSVSVDNLCLSKYRAAGPWGGPIGPTRFGIQDFSRFHPAALALLPSDVYRLRFDYRQCPEPATRRTVPRIR